MAPISCPACHKKLSVKEEMAGKKARCPGCGQTMTIPAPVSVARSSVSRRNHLPGRAAEQGGLAPPKPALPADASDVPTIPPSGAPSATHGIDRGRAGMGAALTAFLAPPQSEDELGRLGK